MEVTPYLGFEGRCDEAIEFYKKAVGAQVQMLMRFREAPDPQMMCPEVNKDKVMHARLQIGDSVVLASDGQCSGKTNFHGIALCLTAGNDAEAKRMFDALSNGGQVQMPLGKTFFSSAFGMLQDRFGVGWMVYVTPPDAR